MFGLCCDASVGKWEEHVGCPMIQMQELHQRMLKLIDYQMYPFWTGLSAEHARVSKGLLMKDAHTVGVLRPAGVCRRFCGDVKLISPQLSASVRT